MDRFHPIAYTIRVLADSLKQLQLWLPSFMTSCFTFVPQFEKILVMWGVGGGGEGVLTVIFQTRGNEKQEPSGHPTSASNVAWTIVNYSSTSVSWALLVFFAWGTADSHLPIFGKQCYC